MCYNFPVITHTNCHYEAVFAEVICLSFIVKVLKDILSPLFGGGDKGVGALGNYQGLTFCWQEIGTMLVSIPRQFAFNIDSFRFVFL
jgi:hypothetical protein